MRVYLVSDFHLAFSPVNEEETKRTSSVIEFLNYLVGKADVLILAGDIFDLWYDWRSTIIKGYFPVLKKLADLNESGCRLIFIAGNHDFWFGDFLKKYLDCEVYQEYFSETIDNKRIFVSHGDSYTTNDFRYHFFRYLFRHSFARFLFSILHPEIALRFGRLISRTSRSRNPNPPKNEERRTTGLDNFAASQAANYDLIVLGHSHIPKITNIDKTVYINTGDWVVNNSFVRMSDGNIELIDFKKISGRNSESANHKKISSCLDEIEDMNMVVKS